MKETIGQIFSDAIKKSSLVKGYDPSFEEAKDISAEQFVTFSDFITENANKLIGLKSLETWMVFLSKNLKSVPNEVHRPCLNFLIKLGTLLELNKTKELDSAIKTLFQKNHASFEETALKVSRKLSFSRPLSGARFMLKVTGKDTSKIAGWYLKILGYAKEIGGLEVVGKRIIDEKEHVKKLNEKYKVFLTEIDVEKFRSLLKGLVRGGYLTKQAFENQS